MVAIQEHRFPQVTLGPVRKPVSGLVISAMQSLRSDALTEEQLAVDVYVQVITFVKLFLIYVRWDQVWGTGGHLRMRVSTFGFNRMVPAQSGTGPRPALGLVGPGFCVLVRTRLARPSVPSHTVHLETSLPTSRTACLGSFSHTVDVERHSL
jgi:hypothetical protein